MGRFIKAVKEFTLFPHGQINQMNEISLRVSVLLSVQRALLGAISPRVRAVLCSWEAAAIKVRAVFDGPVADSDVESMSIVETELVSDFPDFDVGVLCVRIDGGGSICLELGEVFVFRRKED
ncbi:hypothetical protein [Roseateles amylovorans]|uniref:Uncharacterized protein n=1 Tax=Roseateles amylovorans TaxID=2978473 RepID=A0ABY6AUL4_9BURK|nr:hypothetical protein [Roseateles amylovorans]UXH76537.1 hypothetical protein N4261_15950 [Roseateles amylovorans]